MYSRALSVVMIRGGAPSCVVMRRTAFNAVQFGKVVENLLPVRHVIENCVSRCGVDYCHEIGIALEGLGYYGPAYVG